MKHWAGKLLVQAVHLDRDVRASGLGVVAPSASVMTRAATFDWDVRDPWGLDRRSDCDRAWGGGGGGR